MLKVSYYYYHVPHLKGGSGLEKGRHELRTRVQMQIMLLIHSGTLFNLSAALVSLIYKWANTHIYLIGFSRELKELIHVKPLAFPLISHPKSLRKGPAKPISLND